MYLCVPLYRAHYAGLRSVGDESNCALIVSLEDTAIAICSYGALVSSGRFKGFCVNFAENFDSAAQVCKFFEKM